MSELLTRGPNWRKFSLNGLYQFCELCYHIYNPRNPFSLLSLIKKEVRKKRGDFSLKIIAVMYITLNKTEEMGKIDAKESSIYSSFK